jgi:hypothetical protein
MLRFLFMQCDFFILMEFKFKYKLCVKEVTDKLRLKEPILS